MKKIRTCAGTHINSGSSACKIDWSKVKGAILVEPGTKLPDDVTAEKLAEMCHADRPGRIYPISPFFEYAKNGGEAQISAVGYGPNQFNGLNAQTDTFTLAGFDEVLNAQLLKQQTGNGTSISGTRTICLSGIMTVQTYLQVFRCPLFIQL